MRARPARGYAALIVLRVAAAEPSLVEAAGRARGELAQPAVGSVGLVEERSIAGLEARARKHESFEAAARLTAGARREHGAAIDRFQRACGRSRRIGSLARLPREDEDVLQTTRTGIEARANPAPEPEAAEA